MIHSKSLSEIFHHQFYKPEHAAGATGANLARTVHVLDQCLIEVKAAKAPELPSREARLILFQCVDAIRTTLRCIVEGTTSRAWIEPPAADSESDDKLAYSRRHTRLLRSVQVVLVVGIVFLALVEFSLFTVVLTVLVAVIVIAEVVIVDLDPFKDRRGSWLRETILGWFPRSLRSILGRHGKVVSGEPKANVRSEIRVEIDPIAHGIEASLDFLHRAITELDAQRDNNTTGSGDEIGILIYKDRKIDILRFLQRLDGAVHRSNDNDQRLRKAVKAEVESQLECLGIEVSDWNPETPVGSFETRASSSVEAPVTVRRWMRLGERTLNGLVYKPKSLRSLPPCP